MGNSHSTNGGKHLLAAVHAGDFQTSRDILAKHPGCSTYVTCMERNSPLLLAAAKGHARLVQAILEAAVLSQGLSRAKKRCINHSNAKGQSALILACTNGHAQVVEVLVCNGASPLVLDNARHNSALHWAASCCRADCINRLLGSGAIFQMQSGQQVAIADIPCFDEDNSTLVKFVDRHNGWGLTALHLATYKGSSSTVRALLRHGASVTSRSTAPSLSITPSLQPPGSTALHFAAAAEDVSLVLVLLEAQVSQSESDLRRAANSRGDRPLDLARSSSNPLLLQLLDPTNALSLHAGPRSGLVLNPGSSLSRVVTREGLRQHQALLGLISGAGAAAAGGHGRVGRRGGQPGEQLPHVALGALLQRLKLVLSLEAFALRQQLGDLGGSDAVAAAGGAGALGSSVLAKQQAAKRHSELLSAAAGDDQQDDDVIGTAPADSSALSSSGGSTAAAAAAAATQSAEGLHGFSSSSNTPPEISPISSDVRVSDGGRSGGDDTRAPSDARVHSSNNQQQQPQVSTAQLAAKRMRLRNLEQLMAMADEMMARLPTSATAGARSPSSSSNSPRGSRTSAVNNAQQQRGEDAGALHPARSSSGGGWGRQLGSILARSSTGAGQVASEASAEQQQHHHRLFGRLRNSGHADSASGTSSPASAAATTPAAAAGGGPIPEDMLTAFITPSTLSSLAAVIKLFVGASSLQQQSAAGAGQQQEQQGVDLGSACWAEQEHALVLMKGILQTVRHALDAAQQAATAAASRLALRQRHQQQIASLVGQGDRVVHSHTLRRALLGERLHTDHHQGRSRSSSAATASTAPFAAAYYGSSMSMGWGLEALSSASAGVAPVSGRHSSRRHRSRRHSHHGDPAGLTAGDGSAAAEGSSRRQRHHSSSRHRRSSRRRTPRAVDLPLHVEVGGMSGPSTTEQQHHQQQQYLRQLMGVFREHGQQQQQEQLSTGQDGADADAGNEQYPNPSSPALAAAAVAGGDVVGAVAASAHAPDGGALTSGSVSSSSSSGGRQFEGQQQEGRDNGPITMFAPLGSGEVVAAAAPAGSETDDSSDSDGGAEEDYEDGDDATAAAATAADASSCSSLDATTCAICMDCTAGISVSRCSHSLCLQCAYQLCYKAKGLPLCPFCRQPIDGFDACNTAAAAAATTGMAGVAGC